MEPNVTLQAILPPGTTRAERINRSLVSSMNSSLSKDPGADLKPHFETYERRRKKLGETDVSDPAKIQINEKQKKAIAEARERENLLRRILPRPDESLAIASPISPRIYDALNLGQNSLVSSAMIVALSSAIQDGNIIWSLFGRAVVGIGSGIIVKTYPGTDNTEALALSHVRKHSKTIPVPDLFGLLYVGSRSFLFLSHVVGAPLQSLWPSLDVSQKHSIRLQLIPILAEIRSLPLPAGSAMGGGSPPRCKDVRRTERVSDSILSSPSDFNRFLIPEIGRRLSKAFSDYLHSILQEEYPVIMTHGDLHPRNIMVEQKDRELIVTALIDWETSGTYPVFWEYVKALSTVSSSEEDDWCLYLPEESIGRFPNEYAKDCILDRILS